MFSYRIPCYSHRMLQGRGDGERRANIVPAGHGSGGDTIAERYVVADQRETAEGIGTMVRSTKELYTIYS